MLRNFEGVLSVYTEPDDNRSVCLGKCRHICDSERELFPGGIPSLFEGEGVSLEPKGLARDERRLKIANAGR